VSTSADAPRRSKPPALHAPALYAVLFPDLREIARQHGYALALHGSLLRDLDLVAVPWEEEAAEPEALVEALRQCLAGFIVPDGTPGGCYDPETGKMVAAVVNNPEHKPHGRLAWNIHIESQA
jgi:hypothetical protein